jgi:hypothetical protein
MVEDERAGRFSPDDLVTLSIVASVVANAVETLRRAARAESGANPDAGEAHPPRPPAGSPQMRVRHFAVDGSTFVDGEYMVKGVAGKLLWSLLRQYTAEGRTQFTNREVRLDPTLELPDFRDNFESRLILLKRRLDERAAPVRIEKTGRGRFRLLVNASPLLDPVVPA